MTELVNQVPTSAHAENYGRIVKDLSTKRDLISEASKLVEASFDEVQSTEEVLNQAEKIIFGLSQERLTRHFVPVKDALAESFDTLDELNK